jgi:hypothetical protein
VQRATLLGGQRKNSARLPAQELPDMKDFFFIRAEHTSAMRLNGLAQSRDHSMEDCRRRHAVEKAHSLERVVCS